MCFFNVGACTALIRVLYCIVYALRTACTVVIFFVSVFLLLCNLFSQCMGVHCLVNHTCNALIMVLYCTFIYFRTTYTGRIFFFLCFCSYVFFLSNLGAFTASLRMCKLNSTEYVLHWYTICTACVLFAHYILFSFCALLESNDT